MWRLPQRRGSKHSAKPSYLTPLSLRDSTQRNDTRPPELLSKMGTPPVEARDGEGERPKSPTTRTLD